jgi:hypothetical protein
VELVCVTAVEDEAEAEALLDLLRGNGIDCSYRRIDIAVGAWTGWACTGGPVEVLVNERDLAAARGLLPERVT